MRELVADMTDPTHLTHKYCTAYVLKKINKHSQKIKIRKSTEVQHNCLVYKPYSIHQLSSHFYRKGESFCFCFFFPKLGSNPRWGSYSLGLFQSGTVPLSVSFIPWMFLRHSGQFFGSIAFIWVCLGSPPLCIFGSVQVCCGVGEDSWESLGPVNPKGNQSWTFTGRTDDEAPIL